MSLTFNPIKHSLIDTSFRGEFDEFPRYDYQSTRPNVQPIPSTNFSTPYNILIEKKFLNGLFDDQWISSSVIANYCKVAGELFHWGVNPDDCYVITDSEVMGMKNPEEFSKSRIDPFPIFTPKRKRVGVVVNKNNMHWVFIGLLVEEDKAVLYDSMFTPGTANEYLRNVTKYAQWERSKHFPGSKVIFNLSIATQFQQVY